jgi:hyperosmotically inducible protein
VPLPFYRDNASAQTGEIRMNIRSYPLVLGIVLTAGMTILATGCDRQKAVPYNASEPPKTTVGMEIDDTVVTTRVKSALLNELDIKGFDVKVETRKGMVLLSGFVDNQARSDRAISIARAVEGVKGVENGMTLKDGKVTVGNKIDDSIVTTKVKSALLSDPSVNGVDIAVVTSKGEVQLSGFVDNQEQIGRALDITRAVEGVQGIVNKMSVKK